jgi:hypothetical protein
MPQHILHFPSVSDESDVIYRPYTVAMMDMGILFGGTFKDIFNNECL